MHVHPDVEVGNEIAAARRLELLAFSERVHTAEDQVAATKKFRTLLPAPVKAYDFSIINQAANDSFCDADLRGFHGDVARPRSNKPVQVGLGNNVAVERSITPESEVPQLLDNVRSP